MTYRRVYSTEIKHGGTATCPMAFKSHIISYLQNEYKILIISYNCAEIKQDNLLKLFSMVCIMYIIKPVIIGRNRSRT